MNLSPGLREKKRQTLRLSFHFVPIMPLLGLQALATRLPPTRGLATLDPLSRLVVSYTKFVPKMITNVIGAS
jgi:hypothetical protein